MRNSQGVIKPEEIDVANIERNLIIDQIDNLNKKLQYSTIPFCDLYIIYPCSILNEQYLNNFQMKTDYFTQTFDSVGKVEFQSYIAENIVRKLLNIQEIVCFPSDKDSDDNDNLTRYLSVSEKIKKLYFQRDKIQREIGRQKVNIYISIHQETNLAIITIAIPACTISPLHVLDQMSSGNLCLANPSNKYEYITIDNYLKSLGIEMVGLPRASIFLSGRPGESDMISLLATEADSQDEIVGKFFVQKSNENITQYAYVDIFASETCLIEIPHEFQNEYHARIPDEILTLFIIELLMFQEGALSRVSKHIAIELSQQKYIYEHESFIVIERLSRNLAKAAVFWDIRNFRYRTAQNLADSISLSFGIDKLMKSYEINKSLLEQLISMHAAKTLERENKNINMLLIILTFVQIIPTLYSISLSGLLGQIDINQLKASVLSFFMCLIL